MIDSIASEKPHQTFPKSWQGSATLTYCRQGEQTVPQVQTQAPVKVQQPFYPEGPGVCHSALLHTAGGMVGGDRLRYTVTLQPQTHSLITTAAAAKIYTDHPQPAQVEAHIRVASGAWVEWLPQEVIVFEGAQYEQTVRVDLAAEAHWLGWDIMRLGRTARGEQFRRGQVRSRCEIWHDNTLIWLDSQRLVGSEALWQSAHALNSCPVIATLTWVGALPDKDLVTAVRASWEAISPKRGEAGVTRLQLGLLCRYRGTSTAEARRWFIRVWQHLRPYYGQRPAVIPRLWPR